MKNVMRLSAGDTSVDESFWQSLRYFAIYRILVAVVFLFALFTKAGATNLASQNPPLFLWVNVCYLLSALFFLFAIRRFPVAFNFQLSLQVIVDVIALSLLMSASGGTKGGIAFMLVVVVAAAGLVGQGRLTLFYAALASLGALFEQTYRSFRYELEPEDFVNTGLTSIGFFATAWVAQLLSRRVVANERLATQRGEELIRQISINRQVVQDMEDGVLVVDSHGNVRLHNPKAATLLRLEHPFGESLRDYCPALADYIAQHQPPLAAEVVLAMPEPGRSLHVRFLSSQEGDDTLIYLQDVGRAEAQAQQLKLAALGRLTANIAHEIRNPLASIGYAAELLTDEQRAETRNRLVNIISDNSQRLNRLVGEVLELGRRDQAHRETVDLSLFLPQFVEEYSLRDAKIIDRVRVIVADALPVCFDRSHLYRVLENLVTNALRYASSQSGAVTISAMAVSTTQVDIKVCDDGPGVAELDRAKVFEPFFTTRGSGTGLGLYIAKTLCDANGAVLSLLEGAGNSVGACFQVSAKGGICPPESNVEDVT